MLHPPQSACWASINSSRSANGEKLSSWKMFLHVCRLFLPFSAFFSSPLICSSPPFFIYLCFILLIQEILQICFVLLSFHVSARLDTLFLTQKIIQWY